jgi:8-oxo-dGTP pyrophosphatase MutT (NUDIX family)
VEGSRPVPRAALLALLARYLERHPGEAASVGRVRRLVAEHEDCFERTCVPGHITASAWILSADLRSVLLTHHRKLGRWLQLGGHADGDADTLAVALREAREESGMQDFRVIAEGDPALPLDVDVHAIPARGAEPAHLHHDLRYLLVAAPGQELVVSSESHALRWVERARLRELSVEPSLLRMERKARRLLGGQPERADLNRAHAG